MISVFILKTYPITIANFENCFITAYIFLVADNKTILSTQEANLEGDGILKKYL